ncbi:MAG: gliding motility-associated C-terminal domain-containing protein, partial [Chitinophagaceae bacterium]|nr:gliding motility-associated C-terminal domain-containing protein [Chitinophagaceae bacterium]
TAVDNGDIPNVYQWRFGDGNVSNVKNPTHVYAVQGPYTVTLYTLKSGCIDSAKININTAHPINAAFSANGNKPDSACIGTAIDVDAFLSQPNGFLTYAWDWGDGNTTNTGFSTSSHNYSSPGIYTILLTVTDTLGCTDTMTRAVFIDDAPYVSFTTSDNEICVGESIFFKDTVAPFTSSFQWDFQDGTFVNNVHNPIRTFDLPGSVVVTLTGFYKVCPPTTHTENILIHAFPTVNLGEDTMMCPGLTGSLLLTANSSPAASFAWNTQETTNSILVTQPGHYWVKASEGDCATTDSIWVKQDCYLNIPNSFSPNGDGRNDYFLPRELLSSGVAVFHMNIYNRWGENIFNTTKIDGRGWDGKYNEVLQPLGVYVYVIDVVFKQGVKKSFTGNVTLVR